MHRLISLCYVLQLLSHSKAAAQGVAIGWPPLSGSSPSLLYSNAAAGPLTARALSPEASDTIVRLIRPTYWKEGGIIAGVAAGAFLTYVAGGFCAMSESARNCTGAMIGGALIGSGIGFALGALIGGAFDKNPKSELADTY